MALSIVAILDAGVKRVEPGGRSHNQGRMNLCNTYPSNPVDGMVSTQVQTMLATTVHLTAPSLRVAPTPMIEAEITWVVDSGMPR